MSSRALYDSLVEQAELCPETGCLNWKQPVSTTGYGRTRVNGKRHFAHRAMMFAMTGRWVNGFVSHHCGNASCINPIHLFIGQPKRNVVGTRTLKGEALKAFLFARAEHEPSTGCMIWKQYVDLNGNGRTYVCGRTAYAHAAMVFAVTGEWPNTAARNTTQHSCNNKSCINPKHLSVAKMTYSGITDGC